MEGDGGGEGSRRIRVREEETVEGTEGGEKERKGRREEKGEQRREKGERRGREGEKDGGERESEGVGEGSSRRVRKT